MTEEATSAQSPYDTFRQFSDAELEAMEHIIDKPEWTHDFTKPMIRRQDWEVRLNKYLGNKLRAKFAYGRLDCVLFSAGCLRAMTGHDIAYGVRRKYNTALTAAKVLRDCGFKSPEDLIDHFFPVGCNAHAHRGDLVMYADSIGIAWGHEGLFIGEEPGLEGLVRIPRQLWQKSWHVPYEHEFIIPGSQEAMEWGPSCDAVVGSEVPLLTYEQEVESEALEDSTDG